MKKFLCTIVSLFAVCAAVSAQITTTNAQKLELADYVNPLVGSESSYELSAGNTYPAIAVPWGMNFWTPQTGKNGNGWQYTYDAHKIRGFKQTHQPSPWINDYGQFSLMPVTGKPIADEEERASWFSHKGEESRPYYYKVYLAEWDVVTEIVPSDRAAMFRFTFPDADSYIVIDAFGGNAKVTIDKANNTVTGFTTKNSGGVGENFRNYFVVKFDKPLSYTEELEGKGVVGFKTRKGEVVHAKVASSFISEEQALINLKELGNESFDALKRKAKAEWNKVLGRIEVDGGSDEQYSTFYSCLYRSLLFPRKLYEVAADGNIWHYSPHTGKVEPGYMYTDTGFWDTFRCLFPLLNLMFPSENQKIQEGLLNTYRESGFFPEWASPGHRGCMVGNNSASVLVDAYMKGVKVTDVETLYEGLMHATQAVMDGVSSTGRLGHEYYNTLGYIPYDVKINESAARTLEYCYDDWCILQFANELNRSAATSKKLKKQLKKDIPVLEKRVYNYRNLFDPETKLMRGKLQNGEFMTPFSPLKWGDAFTEGNSWHYTWSVFHDPQGLIDLMGGKNEFAGMLDSVFSVPPIFDDSYYGFPIHEIREMTVMNMGNYAHGNQPIQHMIYLYDYAGQPWKGQYWLRRVMDTMYSSAPDGYCGDEDNGQTSAWYVFSALGFYPVCPGSDQYILGSPLFKKATLHLENGKDVIINAGNNNSENVYISNMKVGGLDYTKNYLQHGRLMEGCTIDYQMSSTPNTNRGIGDLDMPYSYSKDK